jgi:glycosyltransferase involved in cell wall biosynthesis
MMSDEIAKSAERASSATTLSSVPSPGRRIIIDVTDFVAYMVKSRTVSGIQRVISAIAQQSTDPEQVIFSVRSRGAFRMIPYGDGMRPIDTINAYIEWKRAIRTIRTKRSGLTQRFLMVMPALAGWRRLRFRRVKFRPTDMFFIFGAVWNKKSFLQMVAQAKLDHGMQIGVFVHDAIPIFGESFVSYAAYRNFSEYLEWIDDWADQIFCNSHFSKLDLVKTNIVAKASEAKVILLAHEFCSEKGNVPEVSRQSARHFIREQFQRHHVGDFAVCVGTIEARKNQAVLVRAWTELARERRMPVLILAGKLASNAQSIQIMLDRDKPPVAILENASDAMLAQLYRDCRFTIFPSLFEGWGLPVGESLWFGKHCLASSASSVPEVGGEHAIYFDPHSIEDIKDKIRDFLDGRLTPPMPPRSSLRTWEQVAGEIIEKLQHP